MCSRLFKSFWVGLVFALFSTTVNLAIRYFGFREQWPINPAMITTNALVDFCAFVFMAYQLLAYQYRKNVQERKTDRERGRRLAGWRSHNEA